MRTGLQTRLFTTANPSVSILSRVLNLPKSAAQSQFQSPVSAFHTSAFKMVKVGDSLPDIDVLTENSPGTKINLAKELTGNGVIVGVPAAFSKKISTLCPIPPKHPHQLILKKREEKANTTLHHRPYMQRLPRPGLHQLSQGQRRRPNLRDIGQRSLRDESLGREARAREWEKQRPLPRRPNSRIHQSSRSRL
jgi:hypothetical protein